VYEVTISLNLRTALRRGLSVLISAFTIGPLLLSFFYFDLFSLWARLKTLLGLLQAGLAMAQGPQIDGVVNGN
jgi:hypothetical protein